MVGEGASARGGQHGDAYNPGVGHGRGGAYGVVQQGMSLDLSDICVHASNNLPRNICTLLTLVNNPVKLMFIIAQKKIHVCKL
jgi:hypothetical protein